jgi:hypothetical protein
VTQWVAVEGALVWWRGWKGQCTRHQGEGGGTFLPMFLTPLILFVLLGPLAGADASAAVAFLCSGVALGGSLRDLCL